MTSIRALLTVAAVIGAVAPLGAQSMPGGSVSMQSGFGRGLAISGGEIFVGESQNQARSGVVYIYHKTAGKWTELSRLTAPNQPADDGFGSSIAVDGPRMLVGATRANAGKGAAYIFERDAKGWHEAATLTVRDSASDGFGSSVAIHGDVAVVAAPSSSKQAGMAFVFRRSAGGWTLESTLVSPDAKEQTKFGSAVAIAGDNILVGETGANDRTGVVHVFSRANGAWTAESKLAANGLQKNDQYGAPIVVDGERVLVGAVGFASNSGAVFTFTPDDEGGWHEAGRYLAYDGHQGDQFGLAVAATDGNVWIGAPRADSFRGSLYHIWSAANGASGAERMAPEDVTARSFFAAVVAADRNVAAATVANADYGLGAVVVYEFANNKWTNTATLRGVEDRIPTIAGKKVECTNGKAAGFDCKNVELMSYLSVPDMGGGRGVRLNDIWGWTDPVTGKEWALVGRVDGTSFVDISNPEKPVYVADLPMTKGANAAAWRDIKVYSNHAYIVADGSGAHGMQVFDLTRLRNVKQAPVTFEPDFTYRKVNSVHNIVINEQTGFAYAVGASSGGETCGGGLHMISLKNPDRPEFVGCFADPQTGRSATGYTHDAECVVYHGPDKQYTGHEICLGSNETMLSIADVTDKQNPKAVARASYPNVGYAHQGWFDEQQRYFYMDDELDEIEGKTPNTRTIIWDLTDLDDPQVATMYLSPTAATDHNLYIKGDTMYQSHYVAGVRVVDISKRTAPVEIGFFDTVPYGGNTPGFGGSWSNYPYFKSGVIIATSGSEGLFVLKAQEPQPVL